MYDKKTKQTDNDIERNYVTVVYQKLMYCLWTAPFFLRHDHLCMCMRVTISLMHVYVCETYVRVCLFDKNTYACMCTCMLCTCIWLRYNRERTSYHLRPTTGRLNRHREPLSTRPENITFALDILSSQTVAVGPWLLSSCQTSLNASFFRNGNISCVTDETAASTTTRVWGGAKEITRIKL